MHDNKKNIKSKEYQTENNTDSYNRSNKGVLSDVRILHENEENEDLMNASVFDDTLKEIDSTLRIFEQKIDYQQVNLNSASVLPGVENNLIEMNDLSIRIKNLEIKINEIEISLLKNIPNQKESTNNTGEHKINENNLSLSEAQVIEENYQVKKKSTFGFFFYFALINLIFLILYGSLIYFKDIIILNIPITEQPIIHFFEVVDIIKITVIDFINYSE
jgi:hypothetical protein